MDLKCTLETRTSKSKNQYQCCVIQLTPDYEKVVFLDRAELALLKEVNPNVETTTNPFEQINV